MSGLASPSVSCTARGRIRSRRNVERRAGARFLLALHGARQLQVDDVLAGEHASELLRRYKDPTAALVRLTRAQDSFFARMHEYRVVVTPTLVLAAEVTA